MTDRMKDKVVLVVGGATGIGYETVKLLVAEGAKVLLADVSEEGGRKAVAELGADVVFVKCDVSREDDVKTAVEAAVSNFGRLDAAINNAAVQFSGEVTGFDIERWDKIMAVNPRGAFFVAKYAVPHLKAAGGGALVNTASTAGLHGGPGMTAYSASKGAVVAFGRALAMELAPQQIRVNTVCPGWCDTAFNGPIIDILGGIEARDTLIKATVPLQRQAHPNEMAPLYVYLVSDESRFMTGQAVVIDGGMI